MNWGRVFLCGLVAGGVWTLLSVTLLALVGGDFVDAVPGGRLNVPSGGLQAFLLLSNFAAGIWAMWLYAAIRPRYGPGPKTALVAGLAWWIIVSLQSGKWVALLSVRPKAVLTLLATTLPAIIVSAVVGAWPYEERTKSSHALN